MKKSLLWVACLLALGIGIAAQDALVGTWTGTVEGGRGPQTVTLVLKMDAGKLAGSVSGGRGGEAPITDVTFANNTLKFKSTQRGRAGDVEVNWSGTVKGEEISMTRTAAAGGRGGAQEFVLKKQK